MVGKTFFFIFLYCLAWWWPFRFETCSDYRSKYCFYNKE